MAGHPDDGDLVTVQLFNGFRVLQDSPPEATLKIGGSSPALPSAALPPDKPPPAEQALSLRARARLGVGAARALRLAEAEAVDQPLDQQPRGLHTLLAAHKLAESSRALPEPRVAERRLDGGGEAVCRQFEVRHGRARAPHLPGQLRAKG